MSDSLFDLSETPIPALQCAHMVKPRTTRRIMRRRPCVWLVAHDNPRFGRVGTWTIYTVKIRRSYDGRWYHNYNTKDFAWALECWKKEIRKYAALSKERIANARNASFCLAREEGAEIKRQIAVKART